MTETDYTATRNALQHADVVVIPARDGGVVLMANRRAWPEIVRFCRGAAIGWESH